MAYKLQEKLITVKNINILKFQKALLLRGLRAKKKPNVLKLNSLHPRKNKNFPKLVGREIKKTEREGVVIKDETVVESRIV